LSEKSEEKVMNRNRLTAFAAASMIAVASMGTAAAPAQADTTRAGCTVFTPAGPRADGVDGSNRPLVKWIVEVKCQKGRSIRIDQERWEEDDPKGQGRGDDFLGDEVLWHSFEKKGGSFTFSYQTLLPQTRDAGGGKESNEELYQKVRFRVKEGLTTSAWTPYERGPASWIFH
jgi:hypothetical protein